MQPRVRVLSTLALLSAFAFHSCRDKTTRENKTAEPQVPESGGIYMLNIVDSFDWLKGEWRLLDQTDVVWDTWLVLGDSLKGYSFQRLNGDPVLIDLMSISNRDSVTYMNAMPINETNNKHVSFALVKFGHDMARFENPDHDFPQWFEFYRTSDSTLNVQYGSINMMNRYSKFYRLETDIE